MNDLLVDKQNRRRGMLSKSVLVCTAASNSKLILLFSCYNNYFREKCIMHSEHHWIYAVQFKICIL